MIACDSGSVAAKVIVALWASANEKELVCPAKDGTAFVMTIENALVAVLPALSVA